MHEPLFSPNTAIELALKLAEGNQRSHKLSASFSTGKGVLHKKNTGFNFGGRKNINSESSFRGALVIGSSGSGKSRHCLIPSIRTTSGSLIIHDPSGELYKATRDDLKAKSYEIKIFNPGNIRVSESFNFLQGVSSQGECSRKARSIVEAVYGSNLSFWETSAVELISMCILYLSKKPNIYCNLPNLEKTIKEFSYNELVLTSSFKSIKNDELLKRYLAFKGQEEKMKSGIIATALSCLSFLSDEKVVSVTSSNSIDLEGIRKEKVAIYIQSKTTDARYHSVLNSLLFETIFEKVLDHLPHPFEQDVMFLIDEAGGLTIPSLPIAMANVRKYRSGILLAVQDFNQLVSRYGSEEANTIRSNAFSTFVFGGIQLTEAQYLEKLCGTYEYIDERGIPRLRPLITSNEIRMFPSNMALLIQGNKHPIKVKLKQPKKSFISRFVYPHD